VVRRADDGQPVGTTQATVTRSDRSADVAWVIAAAHQGHGYATEAATCMAAYLVEGGVRELTAHIHPEHHASAAVARALGLTRTTQRVDGEDVWRRAVGREA
jgi:RimJ/RimL family protein N-acetyltransferase